MDVADGVEEIYWMEAKHRPRNRSIGPYTLDTHLVSVTTCKGVRRLHVVTSGGLSAPFILRARDFAESHGFSFSFSDSDTMEDWLLTRPDMLRFFGADGPSVAAVLSERGENVPHGILCSAFVVPDDDAPCATTLAVDRVLPGRKYLLVVAFSASRHPSAGAGQVTISWRPDPGSAYLLTPKLCDGGVQIDDVTRTPIVTFPFRITATGPDLKGPVLQLHDGEYRPIRFRPPAVEACLSSPFVGSHALSLLAQHKRGLVEQVAASRPRLMAFTGRAGSGKTRLSQELRDDAQALGFAVRLIRFEPTAAQQEQAWRSLFRWLFGLESNLFALEENDLLAHQLRLIGQPHVPAVVAAMTSFLVSGRFRADLFDTEDELGRWFADAIVARLRTLPPLALELEDAHHLSARCMAPLYFLRHVVETRDALPLCVIVTARSDDTVVQTGINHFLQALTLESSSRSSLDEIPDLDLVDARDLISGTLRWPELRAPGSAVSERIIACAGTNPFSLMQVMTLIAVDGRAATFGRGDQNLLVDPHRFKEALSKTPLGIERILNARFDGLIRRDESGLLAVLCAVAILGRDAEMRLVRAALGRPVSTDETQILLSRGYLSHASRTHLVLSHDLMAEGVHRRPETQRLARQFAKRIGREVRPASIGDERLARVYLRAGEAYEGKGWAAAQRALQAADAREDHRRVLRIVPLVEELHRRAPRIVDLTHDVRFLIAIAHQHCGNTQRALEEFVALRDGARLRLGRDAGAVARFAECAIEAGNQAYLRAALTDGHAFIEQGLDALQDPASGLKRRAALRLAALGHNRRGAILQLAGRLQDALAAYEQALQSAEAAGEAYLLCHTLTDIGTALRFTDDAASALRIAESREVWRTRLRTKERRGLMIDCSERYSECLARNTPLTRAKLLAVGAEAMERGLLFQAADAFLCHAYCALQAREWSEALTAGLQALNTSALAEDLKARLHAYHYLGVAAGMAGQIDPALDYQDQAMRLSADPMFEHSELKRLLRANTEALLAGRPTLAPLPFTLA